ncbi:MAG: PAS domain-containing protein [Gammaproteobacteria bacterium]|nr:MAG: PAS domain-containing protein [Gammaproteobacteria bacterium]
MLNLMECTPIAQFAIGLDHKIVSMNRACELLTGISAYDVIGTDRQWSFFYDHPRPVLADLILEQDFIGFQKLYEGKDPGKSPIVPFAWEATSFFEDMGGKPRHIYFLAAPIFDDDNIMIGAVTTLQDVTEQKLRELSMQAESQQLQQENIKLKSSIQERYRFNNIIGKSAQMQNVYDMIVKASANLSDSASVVIYGESGTGKELVARAVHDLSERHDKPFVAVNCGAIPENLLESAFFGHAKGAFTGAHQAKEGFLDQADGGTLFLDEIGELDLNLQVKLLRAIERKEYSPVGQAAVKSSDFCIVAATNRNLLEEVNKGTFREDFYYRIHVIPITIPPLRERKDDIPLLVDHFLNVRGGGEGPLPGKVMDALYNYHWPGNVRELQNSVSRYMTLKTLEFRDEVVVASDEDGGVVAIADDIGYAAAMDRFERSYILKLLDKKRWNRQAVAAEMGLSRRTLFRRMQKLGI